MFKTRMLIIFGLMAVAMGKVTAQEVQWASKVLDFSSQLSSPQFSAQQVLHQPNALMTSAIDERMSPNAWMPRPGSRTDFIKVGFEKPTPLQQIAIAESYNPSTLSHIYAYDKEGKEYLLLSLSPRILPLNGRLFRTYFNQTTFDVHAVKLVFNSSIAHNNFGIDAIGISNSKIPISISINVTNEINDYFEPEPLSDAVNTPYLELRPLISPDNSTLYFTRRNHPENIGGIKDDEDIWYSERDENGEWQTAKNIGEPLNNRGPNYISSITPDGNSMLVLLGNEYRGRNMRSGVSMTRKTSTGWTEPKALVIDNFYNTSSRANFFLANNQKTLIMAIERDDTRGSRDLYVSFLRDDGTWTEPLNMGNTINSADEEAAPYLATDDKTMFFSSRGFNGYGGYDIYITKRLDDTRQNWSEPENLGSTINSIEDDIFFNLSLVDDFAYFSRGNQVNVDIYRVALPQYQRPEIIVRIAGRVLNALSEEPLEAVIRYEHLQTGQEVGITNSDSLTGHYQIILPYGYRYGYFADKKGYIPISANVDLSTVTTSMDIEKDLYLMPIQPVKNEPIPIVLNNVFFKFDKAELIETSFPELNRLLKLLVDNPSMHIEISGHTCSMGSDAYNQRLSERRAKAIEDYLVKNGINALRLAAIGYGESMPKVSNETEEGRQFNRRVEFKITSSEPITLTY
jgi:OmpA-OmpF porin, OOP family